MLWFLVSCSLFGPDDSTSPEVIADAPLTRVVVEVDYDPDAPPRTGSTARADDLWTLTEVNLAALFEGVEIDVPHELGDMQAIEELAEGDDGTFTIDDLLAISERTRDTFPEPGVAAYHVLFLDGRYESADGEEPSVLGVSLGGTTVVALFKTVIDGSSLLEPIRAFVEQTTLVHELGHAVGLVNTGLEPQSDHEDPEHPGHDIDDRCVMYWANEGAADLVEFVGRILVDESVVLFDQACIDDVRSGFDFGSGG